MKKGTIVFPKQRGNLPKMNNRNFPHMRHEFMGAAYKSDGGDDEDDDEDEIAERKRLLKKIKAQTDEQLESRASAKEFNVLRDALKDLPIADLRTIADPNNGAMALIKKMGEDINDVIEQMKQRGGEDMSVRSQVTKWQENNKEAIAKIKGGTSAELKPFVLDTRAAATMTVGANLGGSAYLPQPAYAAGLNDIVRVVPTFWDYIKKGRTKSAAFTWVNKRNKQGNAAFVGEGAAKPPISFELGTEISNAKKIAASLKASTEILDDIDGMETFILEELRYELSDVMNKTLMTGVLSTTVPAGIQTISGQFTQTGLETPNPNNFDAVRAVVAQLRMGNFRGPITVFVSPIEGANMDMSKAVSQGQYILPPFSTSDGKNIAGATVVEDNNVPAGYMQAAVLDLFKVLIYQDLTIKWGWEDDDFTKNLVTVIAEMRIHSFHSENHNGAFIYDTFANVKAAISAPQL